MHYITLNVDDWKKVLFLYAIPIQFLKFSVSESKVRSDGGIPLQRYLNVQFVLITDSYTELEVRPLQVKC